MPREDSVGRCWLPSRDMENSVPSTAPQRSGAGMEDSHPPDCPFPDWGVQRSMRIWDILIFICDTQKKSTSVSRKCPQKYKNHLRIPMALINALANISILSQILIGSLEPVQLQNKCNPKQKNLKTQKSWGTTSVIFRAWKYLLIPAQACSQYL